MLNKEQREFLLRGSEEELKTVNEILQWSLPDLARSQKSVQGMIDKKCLLEGIIYALKQE